MTDQPMPRPGGQRVTPVARDLFNDMISEREQRGIRTYGTTLRTHNGRDPVQDALEEACDLWQYLTQIMLERAAMYAENASLQSENTRLRAELASLERAP